MLLLQASEHVTSGGLIVMAWCCQELPDRTLDSETPHLGLKRCRGKQTSSFLL
jgi:hypothetical protein